MRRCQQGAWVLSIGRFAGDQWLTSNSGFGLREFLVIISCLYFGKLVRWKCPPSSLCTLALAWLSAVTRSLADAAQPRVD